MESQIQSSKGDSSKSPMPHGGKGDDPSKAPPTPQMLPITRPPEPGTRGRRITLLTNHLEVSGKPTHDFFYHYHVQQFLILTKSITIPLVELDDFHGHLLTLGFEFYVRRWISSTKTISPLSEKAWEEE